MTASALVDKDRRLRRMTAGCRRPVSPTGERPRIRPSGHGARVFARAGGTGGVDALEQNTETRPGARGALDRDAPGHGFDQILDDRQAEPGAPELARAARID